jgi:HSP20 family protein
MKPMIKKSHPYAGYFPSVFDDFFGEFTPAFNKESVPAVNVKENDDRFLLEIAAPGMNKEHFNLEVENDRLTISGERKQEQQEENDKYTRKEFSYQSFKRSFNLPETDVEKDKISAKYENGVLLIAIPKRNAEEVKMFKRIEIA